MREVSQICFLGLELFDDCQGFFDAKVGWMRCVSQCIEDQRIQPVKQIYTAGFDLIGIGTVREVPKSETVDSTVGAVDQWNGCDVRSEHFEWRVIDSDQFQLRSRTHVSRLPFFKRIVKDSSDSGLHMVRRVDRHRLADHEWKQSNVIHTVQMIRVLVGEEHGMHDPDPFAQQLCSQIRCGVDQEVPTGQTKNGAAPRSVVARIGAGANVAAASNGRNTDARPRSQHDEFARK